MTDEEKKALEKPEGEKPADQDGQPDEEKNDIEEEDEPSQKNEDVEEEEEVLYEKDGKKITVKDLSPQEIKTFFAKARDFDGIINQRKVDKLLGKSKPEEKPVVIENDGGEEKISLSKIDEIVDKKVSEKLLQANAKLRNDNLNGAVAKFVAKYKWAAGDEVFDKIKEKFSDGGEMSEEGLLTRIELAAQNAFPKEYLKNIEEGVKSELYLKNKGVDNGDGGGGNSVRKEHSESLASKASKEDKEIAEKYFGGDLEKYMKYKSEKE